MKSLDDIIFEKFSALLNYALSKAIKPDIEVNKVAELDEDMISNLKQEYGIEGIILDVDETLRKNMNKIPEVNEKWLESLSKQLKIIVVSNGVDGKIEEFFNDRGIDYIGFAHKPLKKNILKACEKIDVTPEKVLIVGDSLFSDIYGGKRNNMKTALVKEVEDEQK